MLQQNLDSSGPISTPNAIKRRFNLILRGLSIQVDLLPFYFICGSDGTNTLFARAFPPTPGLGP